MAWRAVGHERNSRDSKSRRSFIKRRVMDGIPIGIIGYLGSKPATWCSIAPRPTYRPLGGIEDANEDPESVWSLVCFYVPRQLRGRGLAQRMISAAVEQARSRGASVVEAYPVDRGQEPLSPGDFTGALQTFLELGFVEVARHSPKRPIVRKTLIPAA